MESSKKYFAFVTTKRGAAWHFPSGGVWAKPGVVRHEVGNNKEHVFFGVIGDYVDPHDLVDQVFDRVWISKRLAMRRCTMWARYFKRLCQCVEFVDD